jgi:5-methylcytosine-specific restriction endonuclease McrA
MSDDQKTCSVCGNIFQVTREFYGQIAATGNFRSRCRECDRRVKAQYAEDNPEQIRAKWERQNARRKAAGQPWSQEDLACIRKRLKDRCFYCATELFGGGEIDHMTSLEEGGTNEFSNLTLACLPCNRAKGGRSARAFMDWRRSRGEYCREIFWPTQEDLGDIREVMDQLLLVLERRVAEPPTEATIFESSPGTANAAGKAKCETGQATG